MTVALIIFAAVLATSILSGIIGMAGGIILMAVLVNVLSVPAAMLLHGAVQGFANGSRAWFLREHIQWHILPAYLAGTAVAVSVFVSLAIVANAAVILIVIGAFPWLARVLPSLKTLNVERPVSGAVCGLVVTAAQLFAGASGPLLDVFYLNTRFTRHQIIASKALTQTIGHGLKLAYYALVVTALDTPEAWVFLTAVVVAVIGTRIGTAVLERISEARFRSASQIGVLAIGAFCMIQGILGLTTG